MGTAARRASDQNRSQGELKRNSNHLVLPESSNKRSKKDNGDPTKKDSAKSDPQTADAMIQNGLYVAEMFAAHVARPYVVSYIVVGKSVLCFFGLLIQLITLIRRHDLHVAFRPGRYNSIRWHQLHSGSPPVSRLAPCFAANAIYTVGLSPSI
jgi:hypothetical protein